MAMSPGGGIMIILLLCWESILKIVNLRTRVLPVKTILSFPFFTLQTFKATNQHQFVTVAAYIDTFKRPLKRWKTRLGAVAHANNPSDSGD